MRSRARCAAQEQRYKSVEGGRGAMCRSATRENKWARAGRSHTHTSDGYPHRKLAVCTQGIHACMPWCAYTSDSDAIDDVHMHLERYVRQVLSPGSAAYSASRRRKDFLGGEVRST
jgi:hypothetical protein